VLGVRAMAGRDSDTSPSRPSEQQVPSQPRSASPDEAVRPTA
jgi:hypothetical protein